MYERLLILDPDRAQSQRLGDGGVRLANLAGLIVGLVVAVSLILALTA